MKKKVLFIISDLQTGGVSKSITSLLNVIDRDRYDVSLLVVSPTGPFIDLLPKDLRIITNSTWTFLSQRLNGTWGLIKSGHPILAIGNTIRLSITLFNRALAGRLIAALMPPLKEAFDVAVDFNGQQQLYYMIDKIKAKIKITFFHSDYAKWPFYYQADKKYYPKVDHIFTISNNCVLSLKKYFPNESNKIALMENISSISLIERMSFEKINDMTLGKYQLLTVGHVCENKGIYWAIEAASILKNRNIDFHWYFIGTVDKGNEYRALSAKLGVEDRIHFLGIRVNPYPYIKHCTIIVHPSKFEGRSIALDEAKILLKPVVVTNFSTVKDQFSDRENATICQMTPQSIADAIDELIYNKTLRDSYISNLRSSRTDNSNEIEKLYSIFDD